MMTKADNSSENKLVSEYNPELFNDPGLWVEKEYGSKAQEVHKKERTARGWSRYDWYNFDVHIMWLAHNVARDVILGSIKVPSSKASEVVKSAHAFLSLREQRLVLEDTYPLDSAALRDKGKQMTALEQESASIFFGQILPYLPHADDRYYTIPLGDGESRLVSGYSLDDMEEIRSYLTSVMVGGILMSASPASNSFNANFTESEWREVLHKMAYALGILQAHGDVEEILYPKADEGTDAVAQWQIERQQQYAEGIQLLIEYHTSLWD